MVTFAKRVYMGEQKYTRQDGIVCRAQKMYEFHRNLHVDFNTDHRLGVSQVSQSNDLCRKCLWLVLMVLYNSKSWPVTFSLKYCHHFMVLICVCYWSHTANFWSILSPVYTSCAHCLCSKPPFLSWLCQKALCTRVVS